jgi:lysozyme
LRQHGCADDALVLLGVRGYFRDSMGKPGVNDRNIYDDAIFVVSGRVYATFNANTDPSVAREGVAVLAPGVWPYKQGWHRMQYRALRQAGPVTVNRDGGKMETGYFGINHHKGSRTTTSSLGCQTIHPDQWPAYRTLVYSEMDRLGLDEVKYVLVDAQG